MEIPKPTLYDHCVWKIYELLKKETWKNCSVNPFSGLPSRIVDDLVVCARQAVSPYELFYDWKTLSLSVIYPLLTSGSMRRLDLTNYDLEGEHVLFRKVLRANSLKLLRFLTWSSKSYYTVPLIEEMIPLCPNLEELTTSHSVNLEALRNCKELRILNMSFYNTFADYERLAESFSVLASLKKLEMVSFLGPFIPDFFIVRLLEHCPHLISVGSSDTLDVLETIYVNNSKECKEYSDPPDQFRLKRCVWGKTTGTMRLLDRGELKDHSAYHFRFPEKVRIAVSLCPFVEELTIRVAHQDSLSSLANLKCLVSLTVIIEQSDDSYMSDFIALLKIIGPQLTFLSVSCIKCLPIDIVCGICPRLQSLSVAALAKASVPVQPQCNSTLKKLNILDINRNALLYLLASCKGLVHLTITNALDLDDNLLEEILKLNPLRDLKVCKILKCNLSKRGMRMFLEKVVSLKRVRCKAADPSMSGTIEKLIKELNLTTIADTDCNFPNPKPISQS